ncbi:uncharacterized protein LOC126416062 [Schistocerca serialis cubense]|uniref:uncharacterized protein LOC126416062 n=1 Tax=Schistocerca serialis cubense TaxID=2023355 RepID=UPI00214EEEE7|nr:uncharacterized protein LOC126416062 [Schistocerca serialis cubense]
MKVKLKNRIWSDIAKDLNVKDGEETKNSWLKLRGSYRDARRRQVKYMKSGAAAENIKPWRYQNQMSFLEPFMTAGPRDSNLGDDSDHSSQATTKTSARSDTLETEELEDNNSLDNEANEQSQDINNYDSNEVSSRSIGTECIARHTATSTPVIQRNQSRKRKQEDVVILLKQSMQQHEDRARQRAEERRALDSHCIKDDPLYNFFISMYQLTKNMPQSYQHRIRGQLFQAVSLAEEEIMNVRSQTPSMSSSSNNSAPYSTAPVSHSSSPYISTDSH